MGGERIDCLVIGCGYLGLRAAKAWRGQGKRVAALTRSRDRAALLAAHGLEPIVGDVTTGAVLPRAELVLYAVGWDRASGKSMREVYVDGLRQVLELLPAPGKLIYISSTSVYGQCDGSWVDEQAATEPAEESGRIVLEAEGLAPQAVKLRFAGIYGPGRWLGQRTLERGEALPGDPQKWLNLIHVDDGVAAVLAAERLGLPGEIVNVCDGVPVTRGEYYTHLAERLGLPAPHFTGSGSTRDTHRRIDGKKLTQAWGVRLRYSTHRAGVGAPAW